MRVTLFVLLFVGLAAVIAGFVLRAQESTLPWQPLVALGMAVETIAAGLLLWLFVVKPGLKRSQQS